MYIATTKDGEKLTENTSDTKLSAESTEIILHILKHLPDYIKARDEYVNLSVSVNLIHELLVSGSFRNSLESKVGDMLINLKKELEVVESNLDEKRDNLVSSTGKEQGKPNNSLMSWLEKGGIDE